LYDTDVITSIVGFPISSYVFAPLGSMAPRDALLVFKAQAALLFALALFLLYQPFRNVSKEFVHKATILPTFLVICLFYEPFWFVFAVGGQSTPLGLLFFVLFHRFYVQGDKLWAALFLSIAILLKPFLVPAVLIFVIAKDFRLLMNLMGWLIFAGGASVLVLGWSLHLEWLEQVRKIALQQLPPWWNNSSIWSLFYSISSVAQGGTLEAPERMNGWLTAIAAFRVLIVAWMFKLVHDVKTLNIETQQLRHQLVSLSILFALFFSDIIWPHYLAFLFIPLVFLIASRTQLSRYSNLLGWLIFLSTLAVQSRFIQKFVLALLMEYPMTQALVAGLFGGGTLVLVLILLIFHHGDIIRSQRESNLFLPNAWAKLK